MPASSSATCGMLSPVLNPPSCKMFKIAKKKDKICSRPQKGGRHRANAAPSRRHPRPRGPTPPPSPRLRPLLPRAPRPRSARLSASGRTCAAALTRVTSGPAPRAHRRTGGGAPRGPAPAPPAAAACFALARARIFRDPAALAGCGGIGRSQGQRPGLRTGFCQSGKRSEEFISVVFNLEISWGIKKTPDAQTTSQINSVRPLR